MPLKTLFGTFAAVYYFSLAFLLSYQEFVSSVSDHLFFFFSVAATGTTAAGAGSGRRIGHRESLTVEYDEYETLPVEIKNKS